MKKNRIFTLSLCLALLSVLLCVPAFAAEPGTTLTLREDWRLTDDLELYVQDGTLTIDGNGNFYIYELGGKLTYTGDGTVVFAEGTILYPAANDEEAIEVEEYGDGNWSAAESTALLLERKGEVTYAFVVFNSTGGSAVSDQVVLYGGTATMPDIPERNGYTFGGWYINEGLTQAYDFGSEVTERITLYAKWTKNSSSGESTTYYTLTFDTNGGSSIGSNRRARNAEIDLANYVPTRDGYDFDGWYSDEGLTQPIDSIKLTENTTIYAGWTKQVAENPFNDISESDYFYNAVVWAVENDVTEGTSATTFSPDMACTRAQMVTFLWRTAGSPEPTVNETVFDDVDSSDYYYNAVLWAVKEGITNGTGVTTFSPDDPCTRAQMVTFLWRFEGCPELASSVNLFTDVYETDYYSAAVLWALEKGITNGTSSTTFSPGNVCTRAQMVTFLYRCLEE